MNRRRRYQRLFACLMLGLLWSATARAVDHWPVQQVAPGVYVHPGRLAGLDDPQRDDIANIGFIVGQRCIAVIDSGGSIKIGQRLRKAIRKVSTKPICYVVNTHGHFDHVLGNSTFQQEPDVQFVGHVKLRTALQNNRNFFLTAFSAELGTQPNAQARIIFPDIEVKNRLGLDLGQRKLIVSAYSPAHTHQDLSVEDVQTQTLWLSDLLFMQRTPSLDQAGSLNGWLETLNKLTQKPFARVIPGHGPVTASWPQAAQAERRYLINLRTDIRAVLSSHGFVEQALTRAAATEKDKWRLFEDNHKRNVLRAFAELEWE